MLQAAWCSRMTRSARVAPAPVLLRYLRRCPMSAARARVSDVAKAPPAAMPRRAEAVHERLRRAIPSPRIELDFDCGWQLLVATILSAQSTDRVVNRVTPELFRRFPTPAALAAAPQEE